MVKQVEVTVARRRSIFTNDPIGENGKPSGPGKFHGPGSKVMVGEDELERLFKQGFIVDPHAKKITAAEVEAADVSAYVPNEGDVKVTEQSDQAIRRSR